MRTWMLIPTMLLGLISLAGCPRDEPGTATDTPAAGTTVTDATSEAETTDGSAPATDDSEVFGATEASASEFALKGEPYAGEMLPIEELRPNLKEVYTVEFTTNAGPITMEVYPELAPIHAVRFLELVRDGFYNDMHIHRIAPDWVMQWGDTVDPIASQAGWEEYINGLIAEGKTEQDLSAMQQLNQLQFEPIIYEQYVDREALNLNIKDEDALFNLAKWSVTFAKGADPDSASTQPFISLSDDTARLTGDQMGSFSPFAYVTTGRETVEQLVADFTPSMESAREEMAAELLAQGAPEDVIANYKQDDLSWGRYVTPEMWDPFERAMISEAKIISGPGPAGS